MVLKRTTCKDCGGVISVRSDLLGGVEDTPRHADTRDCIRILKGQIEDNESDIEEQKDRIDELLGTTEGLRNVLKQQAAVIDEHSRLFSTMRIFLRNEGEV